MLGSGHAHQDKGSRGDRAGYCCLRLRRPRWLPSSARGSTKSSAAFTSAATTGRKASGPPHGGRKAGGIRPWSRPRLIQQCRGRQGRPGYRRLRHGNRPPRRAGSGLDADARERRRPARHRRLQVVPRPLAPAAVHELGESLARQYPRRLLGARRRDEAASRLGGTARQSSLMFAKFSPDGTRVGYVRDNNIYVEDLDERRRSPGSPSDGSATIINGTSDWVYEEELALRDASAGARTAARSRTGSSIRRASRSSRSSTTPIRSIPRSPGSRIRRWARRTPPSASASVSAKGGRRAG